MRNPKMNSIRAISLALGVSISYLLGLTDDPHEGSFNAIAFDLALNEHLQIEQELNDGIHRLELPDGELKDEVKEAEENLLAVVHQICGMNERTISEDILNGSLEVKWNPRKIDIIREYLEDSSVILKKMFAQLQEEPERDKEEPETPAPETK